MERLGKPRLLGLASLARVPFIIYTYMCEGERSEPKAIKKIKNLRGKNKSAQPELGCTLGKQ